LFGLVSIEGRKVKVNIHQQPIIW